MFAFSGHFKCSLVRSQKAISNLLHNLDGGHVYILLQNLNLYLDNDTSVEPQIYLICSNSRRFGSNEG